MESSDERIALLPCAREDSCNVPFQTLDQAYLNGAFAARIVRIAPFPEMAAFAPDDDETDVCGVAGSMLLDLPQPGSSSKECPFDIDAVSPPPLVHGHFDEGLMMREDAQVETGERNTALDDSKVSLRGLERHAYLVLAGNVDGVDF